MFIYLLNVNEYIMLFIADGDVVISYFVVFGWWFFIFWIICLSVHSIQLKCAESFVALNIVPKKHLSKIAIGTKSRVQL